MNKPEKIYSASYKKILLADCLLVYTLFSPVILNLISHYISLESNILRTAIILIGPGLIASGIYVQTSGFPGVKKILEELEKNRIPMRQAVLCERGRK
jgi:hypothetical protein